MVHADGGNNGGWTTMSDRKKRWEKHYVLENSKLLCLICFIVFLLGMQHAVKHVLGIAGEIVY